VLSIREQRQGNQEWYIVASRVACFDLGEFSWQKLGFAPKVPLIKFSFPLLSSPQSNEARTGRDFGEYYQIHNISEAINCPCGAAIQTREHRIRLPPI